MLTVMILAHLGNKQYFVAPYGDWVIPNAVEEADAAVEG